MHCAGSLFLFAGSTCIIRFCMFSGLHISLLLYADYKYLFFSFYLLSSKGCRLIDLDYSECSFHSFSARWLIIFIGMFSDVTDYFYCIVCESFLLSIPRLVDSSYCLCLSWLLVLVRTYIWFAINFSVYCQCQNFLLLRHSIAVLLIFWWVLCIIAWKKIVIWTCDWLRCWLLVNVYWLVELADYRNIWVHCSLVARLSFYFSRTCQKLY